MIHNSQYGRTAAAGLKGLGDGMREEPIDRQEIAR